MAILTGTPFNSYSANLNPGDCPSLSSNFTEIPFDLSALAYSLAFSSTAIFSSSFLKIGTITTWIGANFGGKTNPSSSLWLMIRAPIKRVETPQLVAHT